MKHFRTLNLAVEFYRTVEGLKLASHLRTQLLRASSSIALNLAEGRGRGSVKDQKRFFQMAFGSVRECQAIMMLAGQGEGTPLWEQLDSLAAHLYKLIQRA